MYYSHQLTPHLCLSGSNTISKSLFRFLCFDTWDWYTSASLLYFNTCASSTNLPFFIFLNCRVDYSWKQSFGFIIILLFIDIIGSRVCGWEQSSLHAKFLWNVDGSLALLQVQILASSDSNLPSVVYFKVYVMWYDCKLASFKLMNIQLGKEVRL